MVPYGGKWWRCILTIEYFEVGNDRMSGGVLWTIITRNVCHVCQMFSLDFEWIHYSHLMGPNGDPMNSQSIEWGIMYYTHICNSE